MAEHEAMVMALDPDDESNQPEMEKIDDYTMKFKKLMDFVKVEVDVNSQPIKVPKLKLSFSGNAKDWLGFAHLLKSMLSTNPMSVEEKFLLLMNALPDFLKKDLPMVPSVANYQWIMDHLSQKFGDERR